MTLEEWATLAQPSLLDVGPFTIARSVGIRTRKTNGYVIFPTTHPHRVFYSRTLRGLKDFFGVDATHLWGQVSLEYTPTEVLPAHFAPGKAPLGGWPGLLPGLS